MVETTLIVSEATEQQPIQDLESVLMNIDGIERALVDTDDGEVKLTYNEETVSQEEIIDKIKQEGFTLKGPNQGGDINA